MPFWSDKKEPPQKIRFELKVGESKRFDLNQFNFLTLLNAGVNNVPTLTVYSSPVYGGSGYNVHSFVYSVYPKLGTKFSISNYELEVTEIREDSTVAFQEV